MGSRQGGGIGGGRASTEKHKRGKGAGDAGLQLLSSRSRDSRLLRRAGPELRLR